MIDISIFINRIIEDARARKIIFPLKWSDDFLVVTDARGQTIITFIDFESASEFALGLKREIKRRRDLLRLFYPIEKP
jgi:hypothetical protein